MIKRTVEIGSEVKVSLRLNQLVIENEEKQVGQVPIEDLGVLILDHPHCRPSQALLGACAAAGAVVLLTDAKHLPHAVILPLAGNTHHAKIVRQQVAAPVPGGRDGRGP